MNYSDNKPLILITNDDGINSSGLKTAVEAAATIGNIIVSAPGRQYTGMGRAFPVEEDMGIIRKVDYRAGDKEIEAYAVNGSPAYSVAYGVVELAERKPDLVISGINYGENLGRSITFSGTVGAAFEAASYGIQSIAISLETDMNQHRADGHIEADWDMAKKALICCIRYILENRDIMILNVNIPKEPVSEGGLYKLTRLSRQNYFEFSKNQPERDFSKPYRLRFKKIIYEDTLEKDDDIYCFHVCRKISITPLSTDNTDRNFDLLYKKFPCK